MPEKLSILIVDDERSELDMLIHILEPDYDILVAKSGKAALKISTKYKPDLIILDILMPDMSGFEVFCELKKDDETKLIPVIFITGLDQAEDEEKGLSLGAVDYITKPFHPSTVRARVKTHLRTITQIRTIERLGMYDSLTEIPNRRRFESCLSVEWERASKNALPISLIMLDIDKFKSFNDIYGHAQGDIALKSIAQTLSSSMRCNKDLAARWGGEEFVVLLPETNAVEVLKIAEDIRLKIERLSIPSSSGDMIISATASIGAATMVPNVSDTAACLIEEADKAMYSAKRSGGNKVYLSASQGGTGG